MSNLFEVKGLEPPNFENIPRASGVKLDPSAEVSNPHKHTTSNTFFTSTDNMTDSIMNRPATAIMKVIDKFSSFSGLNNGTGSNWSSSVQSMGNGVIEKKAGAVSAAHLQGKVDKIIKVENKLLALQSDLTKNLLRWGGEIPNPECEMMVKTFSSLINTECESTGSIIEKLEKLKISFKFVNQREKKLKDLVNAKTKIVKVLRESEIKYGPTSSSTTLLNEKLEETVWNLDVLEQQYIRAISKDLKEALVDFAVVLQTVSVNLNDSTSEYYNCLYNLEAKYDVGRNSPNKNGIYLKSKDSGLVSTLYGGLQEHGNENNPSLQKEVGYHGNNSSTKLSGANEGKNFYCFECSKSNRLSRLIIPCTHSNAQKSDGLQDEPASEVPLKIGQNDANIHGFKIRAPSFPSNEQWI